MKIHSALNGRRNPGLIHGVTMANLINISETCHYLQHVLIVAMVSLRNVKRS